MLEHQVCVKLGSSEGDSLRMLTEVYQANVSVFVKHRDLSSVHVPSPHEESMICVSDHKGTVHLAFL